MPWHLQVASALAMEFLPDSIPAVSLAAAAAALYARAASSLLRPRLAALLPVLALLAAAPLAFTSSAIVRGVAAFFLAWLGAFKVALLAARPRPPRAPVPLYRPAPRQAPAPRRRWSSVRGQGGALARLLRGQGRRHRRPREPLPAAPLRAPGAVRRAHLLLPGPAPTLGMETEPQLDRPYLASSLRDFWGRRWNLMVSAILRPSVYDPVRGRRAGLVCGVRGDARGHGVLPQPAVTAFFALHGACCVAEGWCAPWRR
ncbi:unnamed protein product [Triticum aestivum]|uniref:Wax synthase domain-containing protein n=1 Tax=Triticum aestivum TaxID=4565 RepID=A0A7H4LB83_WHEAT|nr:unnamed protein product [Triticum aestivum]